MSYPKVSIDNRVYSSFSMDGYNYNKHTSRRYFLFVLVDNERYKLRSSVVGLKTVVIEQPGNYRAGDYKRVGNRSGDA